MEKILVVRTTKKLSFALRWKYFTSSISEAKVGKSPDISEADGVTNHRQHKVQFSTPLKKIMNESIWGLPRLKNACFSNNIDCFVFQFYFFKIFENWFSPPLFHFLAPLLLPLPLHLWRLSTRRIRMIVVEVVVVRMMIMIMSADMISTSTKNLNFVPHVHEMTDH